MVSERVHLGVNPLRRRSELTSSVSAVVFPRLSHAPHDGAKGHLIWLLIGVERRCPLIHCGASVVRKVSKTVLADPAAPDGRVR